MSDQAVRGRTRAEEWQDLRPFFEAFVFAVGHREAARRCDVSVGTVYCAVNGIFTPFRRTMRDMASAVEAWQAERFS